MQKHYTVSWWLTVVDLGYSIHSNFKFYVLILRGLSPSLTSKRVQIFGQRRPTTFKLKARNWKRAEISLLFGSRRLCPLPGMLQTQATRTIFRNKMKVLKRFPDYGELIPQYLYFGSNLIGLYKKIVFVTISFTFFFWTRNNRF